MPGEQSRTLVVRVEMPMILQMLMSRESAMLVMMGPMGDLTIIFMLVAEAAIQFVIRRTGRIEIVIVVNSAMGTTR